MYSGGAPFEFRQRDVLGHVVENHLNWQIDANRIVLDADQVGQKPRTFVEFDLGNIVRDVTFEAPEVRLMENDP